MTLTAQVYILMLNCNLYKMHLNINKKKSLIVTICALSILSIIVVSIALEKHNTNKEKQRITAFEKEKAKKLESIVAENKKLSEDAAKKEQAEHQKVQNLIDSGSLTTAQVRNNCSRLKNREAIVILGGSCSYKIRAVGSAKMAVVFVSDKSGMDYGQDIAQYTAGQSSKESLVYINEFLKREAARRNNPTLNIEFNFFGPFQQVSDITGDNADLSNTQEIIDALQNTSLQNKVPEADYDMVHYVYLQKQKFRSFAMPSSHRAFTNAQFADTTGVFIHETLHLLGASDKYNNGDCQTRGQGNPFDPNGSEKDLLDIMCWAYGSMDHLNINIITGREIGWQN